MSEPIASFIEPQDQQFIDAVFGGGPVRVDFQYFDDTDTLLDENAGEARYARARSIGRAGEQVFYGNTGSRTLDLVLRFHAERSIVEQVIRPVRMLQAMSLPWRPGRSRTTPTRQPPILYFQLGGFANAYGYMTSFGPIRWIKPVLVGAGPRVDETLPGPTADNVVTPDGEVFGGAPEGVGFEGNMLPYGAEVPITITSTTPRYAQDILRRASGLQLGLGSQETPRGRRQFGDTGPGPSGG